MALTEFQRQQIWNSSIATWEGSEGRMSVGDVSRRVNERWLPRIEGTDTYGTRGDQTAAYNVTRAAIRAARQAEDLQDRGQHPERHDTSRNPNAPPETGEWVYTVVVQHNRADQLGSVRETVMVTSDMPMSAGDIIASALDMTNRRTTSPPAVQRMRAVAISWAAPDVYIISVARR